MLESEIVDSNIIEGGIEVFARAWRDGAQLGFGQDGTIDIERFRIFNPPILVQDENGDVVRTYQSTDPETGEVIKEWTTSYREDPEEAIIQSLEHIIAQVGRDGSNIVPGKIGNTTSTFYPSPSGGSPVDGFGGRASAGSTNWSDPHDGVGTFAVDDATSSIYLTLRSQSAPTNAWRQISRSIFGFDTSAIGGDTISSATLSLRGTSTQIQSSWGISLAIDAVDQPASTDALVTGDFDFGNFDNADQSDTRISITSWNTGGYNDYPFNATGISNINKSGLSWFAARSDADLDDTPPSWQSNKDDRFLGYFADQTGTTNDPKLVVEHAAGGSPTVYNALAWCNF